MRHIGILKTDVWINILNWMGGPLIVIYLISMFVSPFITGKADLAYAQSVWHSWQSLNVGVLAFTSSLIAFNISRYNAEKQRERKFIAARAFLPEALSELTSYFQSCSPLLKEAWCRQNNPKDKCNSPLSVPLPQIPPSYKEIFSRCIESAESDVGEHLAYILTRLQIHHSRLRSLIDEFSENNKYKLGPENIMSYMYCLGELQALVNKTFEFARGQEQFNGTPLEIDGLNNAYLGLDISPENFGDLFNFTQRAVKRL